MSFFDNIWFPLFKGSENITTGTYRFTLNIPSVAFSLLPDLTNKSLESNGKIINILSDQKDSVNGKWVITADIQDKTTTGVQESGIDASYLIAGALGVLALAVGYFTLDKVEKLVDKGTVQVVLLVGAAIAVVILIRVMRKKR